MIRLQQKIKRQEKILLSLSDLTYATSEQLQIINKLGSNRNARRILYELEQDKLIKSITYQRKIYYLTNKGNDFIGRGNTRLSKHEIQHTLMRNDLYIRLGMPITWQKEAKIIVNDEVVLISDARFEKGGKYYFVEIDNKQSMRTNMDKIKKYSDVFKLMYNQFNYHPLLIWYSLSVIRKNKLKESCKIQGIKYNIY